MHLSPRQRLAHESPRAVARGFTLIEVLITLLIASVGLLTVAGLQATARKLQYESAQRTIAIALAQDMVERIHANKIAAASYVGAEISINASTGLTTQAQGTDCFAQNCTPTQMVSFDLYRWGQMLAGEQETVTTGSTSTPVGGLVSPIGCIRVKDATNGIYRVVIAWRGSSPLREDGSDTCGKDSALYAPPSGSVADTSLRRKLFVDFIP